MDYRKICTHCMGVKPAADVPCPHCGHTEFDSAPQEHRLLPRTVLKERYLLGRVLAQDGIGLLYLALDLHKNERRTIRELFPVGICQRGRGHAVCTPADHDRLFSDNRRRMLREIEVLIMLLRTGSEAIVPLLDHFEENNTVYLVLEYQEAIPLRRYVDEHKHLTMEQTVSLMYPIGQTLAKIHSFGTFHGNVQPESILVRQDGSGLLMDFGPIGMDTWSCYIPPEQRQCDGVTGAWSDTYGFAGCLLFCLTGTDPRDTDLSPEQVSSLLKSAGCHTNRSLTSALASARQQLHLKRAQSMDALLQAMQSLPRRPNTVLWTALSVAACSAMILTFLIGSPDTAAPVPTPPETTVNTVPTESIVEAVPAEVTLGSYLLVNYADPGLVMGVEAGYCDNGARLILTGYEEVNHNRILITDHVPDDGFYNLQAAHTNSFLSAKDPQGPGSAMVQYFSMQGFDSEKWRFLFCGEEYGRKVFTLQNAAGYAISPRDGVPVSGVEVVLVEPDPSDATQKWYLVWSERSAAESSVTVFQPGDTVYTLAGTYILQSSHDPESSCILTGDAEPELGFAVGNDAVKLRFERHGSNQYRIYPVSENHGAEACLEYNASEDRLVLRSVSEEASQLFRVIYAGFHTYQLQTSDGRLLQLQPSADLSRSAAVCAGADLPPDHAIWLLTKTE